MSTDNVSQETTEDVAAHVDPSFDAAADEAAAKQTPEEDAAYDDSVGEARRRAFGGDAPDPSAVDAVDEDVDPVAKAADA